MFIGKYCLVLSLLACSSPVVWGSQDARATRKQNFLPRNVVTREVVVVPAVQPKKAVAAKPKPRKASSSSSLNPELLAKVFAAAYLLQGAGLQFAPAKMFEIYELKGSTDVTKALCSDFGSDVVATGIAAWLSLVEKVSAKKAVGYAFAYLLIGSVWTLVTGRQGEIGANNNPIFARVVLFGLGAFSTLLVGNNNNNKGSKKDDNKSSLALVKAVVYFRLAYGLFTIVQPNKAGETWGLGSLLQESVADRHAMRALGYGITAASVLMGGLLHGLKASQAAGYGGFATAAYFFAQQFITEEWEKTGMTASVTNYPWLIFAVLVSSAMLSLK